jgi:hypothetical protein
MTQSTTFAMLLMPLLMACSANVEPATDGESAPNTGQSEINDAPRGLRLNTDAATEGYTLFAPLTGDTTYLIDNDDGQVVRTWASDYVPSGWVYMMDNGHVIRGANDAGESGFNGGGQGGRIQEWDFDGELVWDFAYNTDRITHHDVALLPNGNVLAIVWESKTPEEALQAGRRADLVPELGLWPGMLVEFEPQRPDGARIVWEWHSFDHLIQNVDATGDNYGNPSEHPERIDLNGDQVGVENAPEDPPSDIFHMNGVAYNADLDQIIISSPNFNELWVIDHSTTTAEAATGSGGRSGKGGDLLYRWGNPQTYGRGSGEDQRFGFEHDTRWIPTGRPGAGNMMVFSNRTPGPDGTYSQVYELAPPIDAQGRYAEPEEGPFGPAEPVWTYADPETFDATYISGAERLENGNTLVNSGPQGRMFEVTNEGEIVWEYWSPYSGVSNTGGGGGSANPFSLFRGIKIQPDHPALAQRTLEPMAQQPPLVSPSE